MPAPVLHSDEEKAFLVTARVPWTPDRFHVTGTSNGPHKTVCRLSLKEHPTHHKTRAPPRETLTGHPTAAGLGRPHSFGCRPCPGERQTPPRPTATARPAPSLQGMALAQKAAARSAGTPPRAAELSYHRQLRYPCPAPAPLRSWHRPRRANSAQQARRGRHRAAGGAGRSRGGVCAATGRASPCAGRGWLPRLPLAGRRRGRAGRCRGGWRLAGGHSAPGCSMAAAVVLGGPAGWWRWHRGVRAARAAMGKDPSSPRLRADTGGGQAGPGSGLGRAAPPIPALSRAAPRRADPASPRRAAAEGMEPPGARRGCSRRSAAARSPLPRCAKVASGARSGLAASVFCLFFFK